MDTREQKNHFFLNLPEKTTAERSLAVRLDSKQAGDGQRDELSFVRSKRDLSFFFCFLIRGSIVHAKPDRTLDCIGLYCPEPVFKTRLELDEMKVGETLEVIADDPAAESDIRSLVKNLGQQLVSARKEGDTVHILIGKVK